MNKKQKGFASIVIIGLVVLGLGLLGGTGYFLLNKNEQENLSQQNNIDQKDNQSEYKSNESEQGPAKIIEEKIEPSSTKIEKNYSYPYPVSWKEDNISFFLTGISFNKVDSPEMFKNESGEYYNKGDKLNALTLILKVASSEKGGCAELRIRRVINEYGDMVAPATDQFRFPITGGCGIAENTYHENQEVVFIIPEAEKTFSITSGGTSKVFFTINLLDADNILREKPDIQLETNFLEEGLRKLEPYNADVSTRHDSSEA